jgi:hypothetical protein
VSYKQFLWNIDFQYLCNTVITLPAKIMNIPSINCFLSLNYSVIILLSSVTICLKSYSNTGNYCSYTYIMLILVPKHDATLEWMSPGIKDNWKYTELPDDYPALPGYLIIPILYHNNNIHQPIFIYIYITDYTTAITWFPQQCEHPNSRTVFILTIRRLFHYCNSCLICRSKHPTVNSFIFHVTR